MNFLTKISTLLILAISLAACGPAKKDTSDDGRISIVTTIGMLADAAEEIAGDRAKVTGLMGPGVDPHLYKASAGDVRRLQDADLIIYNGLHLESRMGEVLGEIAGKRAVRAVAESLAEFDLISNENFGSTYDPHVWFDVSLWTKVVEETAEAIIDVDPEGADVYRANLESYIEKLGALDSKVREQLSKIDKDRRVLITAHDAFGYFGKAYGFDIKGLQGISTTSEAGAKDVQDLARFIARERIPAIFVESSVPRKSIEAVQAAVQSRGFDVKIGGELFSDAMGSAGTLEGTYIGMVLHNVKTITSALGQDGYEH